MTPLSPAGSPDTLERDHDCSSGDLEKGRRLGWIDCWTPPEASFRPGKSYQSLRAWLTPTNHGRQENKLHKTAYLDGLRGFAALIVYWHHHELWVHNKDRLDQNDIFENGFGYRGKFYFVAFPGIRIFFSGGHFAVAIFFILSGYVLSIKPHRLIETNDMQGLIDCLSSAIFRRWIRLFLPVFITIWAYATSWHFFGFWVMGASPQKNWLTEMWAFYCEFKNFSFVYKEGGVPWLSYNMHVWSIPAEFKGSMVVFSALIACSRCKPNARIWSYVALIVYFMWIADGWYCAMFMVGTLLRHIDCLHTLGRMPALLLRLKPKQTFACYHLLAASLYLAGVPCENRDVNQLASNRGWYLLSFLKPQAAFDYKWFYLLWAAVGFIVSVQHTWWLKAFFETRFCQYLGRISYALYLVHGPVLWTVGDRLYAALGMSSKAHLENIPGWMDILVLPRAGPVGLEFAFLVPQLILLPITLWLASFVTRAVDAPSVKLAARLYDSVRVPIRTSGKTRGIQ